MTEPFVVPEPSPEAMEKFSRLQGSLHPAIPLAAAYAIDLPALCRAEVERAFKEMFGEPRWPLAEKYLASRFPEAAPEQLQCVCGNPKQRGSHSLTECFDADLQKRYKVTPQPSAAPQVNAAGIDTTQFRMSEKGWRCNVCREEVVSPAHPMFHKCVTPSAGERKWEALPGDRETILRRMGSDHPELHSANLCDCERLLDGLIVPTPTEGERKNPSCAYCDGTGWSEGGNGHKNVCLPCRGTGEHIRPSVPTPSAGEEAKPLSAHPYRYDCFCDACERNRREIEGIELPVGVSAGETKCDCLTNKQGGVNAHSTECSAVGARPEDPNQCDYRNGLGQCVLPRGHAMPHTGEEDFKPRCTACACERCKDREAFVRALAVREAGLDGRLTTDKPHRRPFNTAELRDQDVVAAARKVIRE